ncbi:MAG TPA: L,D-transpeptidase [Chthoniobacterales bacterium]|nr:L,D-transpeptidase [Chthoniobacterales bacterium]
MQTNLKLPLAALFVVGSLITAQAQNKKASAAKDPRTPTDLEAATRLQVFLDRANFGPGKLDGYYGDFTLKALALYRESRGEQPPSPPAQPNAAPDVTGLDLASIDPVFVLYTVTEADLQNVGDLPQSVEAQAKLKALPYRDAAEAIAEKFHCDRDFLEKINPGKTKAIKAGDQLQVPNVEPFEVAAVKELKPGSEIAPPAANDIGDAETGGAAEFSSANTKASGGEPLSPAISVRVDTGTNMVGVYDADRLIAAYPVTIGSGRTESPVGEWKVKGVAKMPNFRHDEKMLKRGVRSDDFHMLAPGPNNPVGVIWIALNKKGIGLHGTDDPDSIGRSASHGCVRLANWDVVRLAMKLKGGVPVAIR